MAEMLVEFSDSIADSDGITYAARAAVRNPIMDTGKGGSSSCRWTAATQSVRGAKRRSQTGPTLFTGPRG